MKLVLYLVVVLCLSFFAVGSVLASPIQPNFNNPNVVAYYTFGTHGVVGENDTHTGIDIVMKAGKSGNFQQWFLGTSPVDGYHGDHSVWKVQNNGQCASNWQEVITPNPSWGDYFNAGVNYCVKTNDFSGTH